MAIYEELEQIRKESFDKYKHYQKIGNFASIGLVVSIIILALLEESGFFIIGFILLIVSIVFMSINYGKASQCKKSFDKIIKDEFVDKMLKEHFDEASFDANSHVSIGKINSAGLTRQPDRYRGEDLIVGRYKGVGFQVSDIILTERRVVSTGRQTTVQYIDYFKGRWYVYKLEKKFNDVIKIFERGQAVNTRGLTKEETEMINFNKKFNIYASDKQFFFYIMNASMIEKLLLLENSHRGTIHYCFIGDELHIGINDNSDSLQVDFKKTISRDSLRRFTEDIVLIKTIVDELRLDDIKFKN